MKPTIKIGYLPILDHLILGISKKNDGKFLDHSQIEPVLFQNWQSIAEAFQKKKIDGTFMLFPLALELYRQQQGLKVVLLGHREGQVLVARNNIESTQDLKGKTIFIPHHYSTHHILLHRILQSAGLDIRRDVKLDIGSPKIQDALTRMSRNAIQAFIIAEPIGTAARRRGVGKILQLSHEMLQHHIDCVLVFHDDVLKEHRDACQEFVQSLVRAGMFVNAYPRQAAEIGEEFLGWPKKILLEALTHDRGHILYWDLLPRLEDFEYLQKIAVKEMGMWDKEVDLHDFISPELAQNAYREWMIDVRKTTHDKGTARSVPGSVSEVLDRLRPVLGSDISARSVQIIKPGHAYPAKAQECALTSSLQEVFSHRVSIMRSPRADIKALVFSEPSDSVIPDRILLRLSAATADRLEEILGKSEKASPNASISELCLAPQPIVSKQEKDVRWLSLSWKWFRVLPLLLE